MQEHEEEDEQDADGASEERLAEERGAKGRLHIGDANLCDREREGAELQDGDEVRRFVYCEAGSARTRDLCLAARDGTLNVRG